MKIFWIPFTLEGSIPIEAEDIENAKEQFNFFARFTCSFRGYELSDCLNTLKIEENYIVEEESEEE